MLGANINTGTKKLKAGLIGCGGRGTGAFRVDPDLRPEGRSGPLVRTIASYRAYWDRWADPWEMQALIKARVAAGASDLGAEFLETAEQFVAVVQCGVGELNAHRAQALEDPFRVVRRQAEFQ